MPSNLHTKNVSPGPAWTTFPEGKSDGDVEIVETSGPPWEKLKKRKVVGDRDSAGHGEGGPSNKRPRHTDSASRSVFNTSTQRPKSGSGASSTLNLVSRSGADAGKPSTAPPSPKHSRPFGSNLQSTSVSSSKRPSKPIRSVTQPANSSATALGNESTASRLAALYSSSRGVGPGLIERDRVKPSGGALLGGRYQGTSRGGERERDEVLASGKGKGKERDPGSGGSEGQGETLAHSSDGSISSSVGPTRNVRVGSTRDPSHSKPRNLFGGPSVLRNAGGKNDRGLLLVNERRQLARKTTNMARPPKKFHFDRPVPSSSGGSTSGTGSSSPTDPSGSSHQQTDRDQATKGGAPRPHLKVTARKSAYVPPPRSPWDQSRLLAQVRASAADGSTSGTDSLSSKNSSESSHSQTDRDRPTEGGAPGGYTMIMARKSTGGLRPPRVPAAQKSIKGKEKEQAVQKPKSKDNEKEVIVIGSSEDEGTSRKKLPPKLLMGVSSKKSLSVPASPVKTGGARGKVQHKKSPSGQMNQMHLIDALNQAYQKQANKKPTSPPRKALEDNIIDLTLDDSDEDTPQDPKPHSTTTPSTKITKQERLSPVRPPLGQQLPGLTLASPSPIIPAILSPKQSAVGGIVSSLARAPAPRPRSVSMASALDPDLDTQKSKPTVSPRPASSGAGSPPVRRPRASRLIRDEDSSAAEDSEVERVEQSTHSSPPIRRARAGRISRDGGSSIGGESNTDQAMVEDSVPSPKRAQSSASSDLAMPSLSDVGHALPEVIPPLRRSLRHSSGSSHSGTDNFPAFTDVESPPDSSPSPAPDDAEATPSYGGFKALTWEHHRKNLNNFNFQHYFAKDIPTSLPDTVNRLSEYTRMDRGMQDIFRAYILESIVDDEPGAPDIEIINDVDSQPTPLFEFKYSNRIWYGEGVPLPDYKKLKGCDCVGRCDPKSKTCSCVAKQREHLEAGGFVYEKNGRLKHAGYPIFECNDLCACEGDCRNRVVQNGRKCQVNIKKTRDKGWGVFNGSKRIPKGVFIGIYAGELLTDEQGEYRGHIYNKIGKTYLFDIDFYYLKSRENPDDEEWGNKYVVDAYHAGNFTRFLNHSCDPNARLYACYINEPDIEKPLLVVFSIRDIEPHEEICFNYQGAYPEDEDEEEKGKEKLKRNDPVYTGCKCGARNCTGGVFR